MKKYFALLCIVSLLYSCDVIDQITGEDEEPSDVPPVRSYVTYTSQNSVTLNGFIDNSNNYYQGSDTYEVGFVFRTGNENDPTNDEVIIIDEEVAYTASMRSFSTDLSSLTPNTTYYYTFYSKNGDHLKEDWSSFTTSDLPCSFSQNNYYSVNGAWQTAYVTVEDVQCCDEGNVGFRFGNWPNIFQVNFNELENGYPQTGQYFGVSSGFDITYIERELVKSTNQVFIEYNSTTDTQLFVENNGATITLIFCNTILNGGDILNGKVSVAIP
ncbi:hypothetical protein HNV08_15020 [Winogradskyella eckloniae]|uniref:hypothetical protein n=1 Tax=Winogradskyella eckloniae TaxID=1089306 RepID=UPI001565DA88|nr:hypothetical protein [Winogradskyella eckloniae]NRD21368.1 hypothetical protein [Winogradskyella eckloniae]